MLTVNPDTYLFWDDIHPTTRGHDILALDALSLIEPSLCETAPGCTTVAAATATSGH